MAEQKLSEKDFESAAEKALSRDFAGAANALAQLIIGLGTGHPLIGLVLGWGVERFARAIVDTGTKRLLAAEQKYNNEQEQARALAQEFRASLAPLLVAQLSELDVRNDERAIQIIRYIANNTATLATQHEILSEVKRLNARLQARDLESPASDNHWDWDLSARGVEAGPGSYFTGRSEALASLATWINAPDSQARVVTGSPGSGKSSVLGRVLALTNPHTLGGDADSAIPIAIYARSKTVRDVASAILTQAGVTPVIPEQVSETDVVEALPNRAGPWLILIDALDEALEPTRLAGFLRKLTNHPQVRLIIGTRRELLAALGPRKHVLDLDDSQYFDEADVAAYVEKRLLCATEPERFSPYRQEPALAREVAERVAHQSQRIFLIARLFADSLLVASVPIVPDDPVLNEKFPENVGEAFREYLDRLDADEQRARHLLTVLAFGEGAGLPIVDLWSMAARSVWGRPYDEADVDWVRERCSAYLVIEEVDGELVCRLYHAAMSGYLIERHRAYVAKTHRALVRASEELLNERAAGQWMHAAKVLPYARRHLAAHAAAAGVLDRFLRNPGFLAVAEPDLLLLQLWRATEALREADVFARAAHLLRDRPFSEALTILDWLAALCGADELKQAIDTYNVPRFWRTVWAAVELTSHRTWYQGELVFGMRALQLGQRSVLAVACGAELRILDGRLGKAVSEPILGHADIVSHLALIELEHEFALVSASWDSSLRFWNPRTGLSLREALPHAGDRVDRLEAMQQIDGHWKLAWSSEGTVQLWDAETQTLAVAPVAGALLAVGELNGRLAILLNNGDTCSLWDGVNTPSVLTAEPSESVYVECGAVFSDGEQGFVAVGFSEGEIRLFDANTRAPLCPLTGHTRGVTCLTTVAGKDGMLIVSGSWDRTIRVWSSRTGKCIAGPFRGHDDQITALAAFTDEGRLVLASGSQDMTVRLWDLDALIADASGKQAAFGSAESLATGVVDGRPIIVAGGERGILTVRDARDGTLRQAPFPSSPLGAIGSVALVEQDGESIVFCGARDGEVHCFVARTGGRFGDPFVHDMFGISASPVIASCELDARRVIVSAYGGRVCVWDARTRALVACSREVDEQQTVWGSALFTIDGQPVLATAHEDDRVQRWNVRTCELMAPPLLVGDEWRTTSVAYLKLNDRQIVVSGGESVRFWDAVSGDAIGERIPQLQTVACLCPLQHLGCVLIGSYDGTLSLWDVSSGKLLETFFATTPVLSACVVGPNELAIGTAHGVALLSIGTSARR